MITAIIQDWKIEIPKEVQEATNLRNGQEIRIEIINRDLIEIMPISIQKSNAFQKKRVVSRDKFEEFLKKVGFSPSEDNPDVWIKYENRETTAGKYIGTVYEKRVNIPALLKNRRALNGFINRYSKYIE